MPTLPNGAGGYQLGDGNLGEVTLGVSAIPTAYTAGATLTTANLGWRPCCLHFEQHC
jgi:hypothetical protein